MPGLEKPQRYEGVELRVQFVALAMTLAFCVLGVQLWRLQVVDLLKWQEKAEENRVWPKRLKSDRGVVYGANDVILADNRASADVVFVPGECPEELRASVAQDLGDLIGVSAEGLLEEIAGQRRAPFKQIAVKKDVSKADRTRVEEHAFDLPGVFIVVQPQRRYLFGETGGQLLGFLGEIDQGELDAWEGYHLKDLVGKDGLERQYESLLHGVDGHTLVTKYASGWPQLRTDRHGRPYVAARDSQGNPLHEERHRRKEPIPGDPLYLTLDMGLQGHCEAVLAGTVGAIVVLDADTGGVLALASSPGYDPSVFITRGRSAALIQELLTEGKPRRMKNRAFREQYPPGSVFKVMLASAALEEGLIDEHTSFYCPGFYQLTPGGRKWHCWKRHGHGHISTVDALAFSCDVFFYNVGLKMGVDRIAEWAARMGLGVKTGIDAPGEVRGLIPDHEWKDRLHAGKPVWDRRWYPGETVNLSIGQGSAATTPLQNAVMMASVINGGYRVRPYLNRGLGPDSSDRFLSDATIDIVTRGMRRCVEKGPPAPTGTGHAAHIPGMAILGKTGSAQVMSLKHHEQYEKEEDIPYTFRDHAWFVCGVVDRAPRVAICVLVEHGHHGSSAAAPLAREVLEYLYHPAEDGHTQIALRGDS